MPKLIIEQPSVCHNYYKNNPAFVVYLKADTVIGGLALIHRQLFDSAQDTIRSGYSILHVASGKVISTQARFFPLTIKTKSDGIKALWAIVSIAPWMESERVLLGENNERASAIGKRMHDVLEQFKRSET